MSQKLTKLQVNEVSLVGKGAIGEKFTVMKSADAPDDKPAEVVNKTDNLLSRITKAVTDALSVVIGKTDEVKKSDTSFNDVVIRDDLTNNFYDGYWILETVMWNILYDETVTDKRSAMATALAQFSDYVLASFDALGIQKSDNAGAIVKKMTEFKKTAEDKLQKSGKKISGSRMDDLKNMQTMITTMGDTMGSFLAEVEGNSDGDIQKGESDVKPEELTAAITNAIAPLAKSLEDIGGRLTTVETKKADTGEVAKTAEVAAAAKAATEAAATADDVTKAITAALAPLTKSVEDLGTRVTTIEKMETPPANIQGQDLTVKKAASKWPSFAAAE